MVGWLGVAADAIVVISLVALRTPQVRHDLLPPAAFQSRLWWSLVFTLLCAGAHTDFRVHIGSTVAVRGGSLTHADNIPTIVGGSVLQCGCGAVLGCEHCTTVAARSVYRVSLRAGRFALGGAQLGAVTAVSTCRSCDSSLFVQRRCFRT